MVRKLHPPCGNIVMQLGFTMQFAEAECSKPWRGGGGFRLRRRELPDARWGGADVGENCAAPRSRRAMEASTQYYLVKGIAIADCIFSLMLL
jgi:hypothetical protein